MTSVTQGVGEAVAMTRQFEMISIAGPDLSTRASGRSRSTPPYTQKASKGRLYDESEIFAQDID
jgi:hypothetical protein